MAALLRLPRERKLKGEASSFQPVTCRIEAIGPESPYLPTVKHLWREESRTLGMFPEGAFVDAAERRTILGAILPNSGCVGYLLYRKSKDRIAITHLCVSKPHRKKGIAGKLFQHLAKGNSSARGIIARCRRDYPANKMWPRLGFAPMAERIGRSRSGQALTVWWYDCGHPDLFSSSERRRLETKLPVAIDANIAYGLCDTSPDANEEVRALEADWIRQEIELCYTDEMLNDIDRISDPALKRRRLAFVRRFLPLRHDQEQARLVEGMLRPLFPTQMREQDYSDLRHLAKAAAARVQVFVTKDDFLLSLAERAYGICEVSVIRPCDLVVRLDEYLRESEYQPVRLGGTPLQLQRLQAGWEADLPDAFQAASAGETKATFCAALRRIMANPERHDCRVVSDPQGQALAVVAYDRTMEGRLGIGLFRTRPGQLADTVARYTASQALLMATKESRHVVEITDASLSDSVNRALREVGFVPSDTNWAKMTLPSVGTGAQVASTIRDTVLRLQLGDSPWPKLADLLETDSFVQDRRAVADAERCLWPAKITNGNIETFIVPIRSGWAQDLFDERMAAQNLFGAPETLALSLENVYYRSARQRTLSAPARILWYTKKSPTRPGTGAITACSRLDEVIVGPAKDLYRRFRRLGVYDWRRVRATAGNDPTGKIMAISFSGTELLAEPVPWDKLQQILAEEGVRSQIQSPCRITSRAFARLYRAGMRLEG